MKQPAVVTGRDVVWRTFLEFQYSKEYTFLILFLHVWDYFVNWFAIQVEVISWIQHC
jgi:hypothetical protein